MPYGRRRAPLERDHINAYSIWPYGEEKTWADKLRLGLSRMIAHFIADICPLCEGQGNRMQTYNAGCGMGYYRASGACDFCNGTGLLQGNGPAPSSVRNQLLVAAEKEENE